LKKKISVETNFKRLRVLAESFNTQQGILGRLVVIANILQDKGMFDEKEVQEAHAAITNANKKDTEVVPVQSERTGNDEDNHGVGEQGVPEVPSD